MPVLESGVLLFYCWRLMNGQRIAGVHAFSLEAPSPSRGPNEPRTVRWGVSRFSQKPRIEKSECQYAYEIYAYERYRLMRYPTVRLTRCYLLRRNLSAH